MSEVYIRVVSDGRTPTEYRCPNHSRKMSVAIGDEAREKRRTHPALHQDMIGCLLGVNHGRVSDALRGFWSRKCPRGPRQGETHPCKFKDRSVDTLERTGNVIGLRQVA